MTIYADNPIVFIGVMIQLMRAGYRHDCLVFLHTHREFEGCRKRTCNVWNGLSPQKVDWVQMLDSSIRSAGVAVPWQGRCFTSMIG